MRHALITLSVFAAGAEAACLSDAEVDALAASCVGARLK